MTLPVRALAAACLLALAASGAAHAEPSKTADAAPEKCEWRREQPLPPTLFCKTADSRWTPVTTPPGFDKSTVRNAIAGDNQAMLLLALFYSTAPQDLKNTELAFIWYEKAAAADSAPARDYLAAFDLQHGVGVAENPSAALSKYLAAAKAGLPEAMFAACQIYASGLGAPRDDAEAFRWCKAAAEAGDTMAMQYLILTYTHGRGGGEANQAEANRWVRALADRGDLNGLTILANQYLNGNDVSQDAAEAARLYGLAAQRGLPFAMYQLANMYSKGIGVPQDKAEALRWMRAAAEKGDARAKQALEELKAAVP